ncbi:PRC-barrel domain-containing protein [Martelella sp. AMO21009]
MSRAVFVAWDADESGNLDHEEILRGVFSTWDKDGNNELDQNEYNAGLTSWSGTDAKPAFSDISGDDDVATQEEFVSGMRGSDTMAQLGFDNENLDADAFSVVLFSIYDTDGNQELSENEYGSGSANAAKVRVPGSNAGAVRAQDVIALADWNTDELYASGVSVDHILDDVAVYGETGEEIGSVENIVFDRSGEIRSIIAEVGGFWDLFDTHVNVPWDEVQFETDRITVPVNEDNLPDYGMFKPSYLAAREASSETQVVDDDLRTGPVAFRATDLIGDFARVEDGDIYSDYGYINDLVIDDGRLAAVVVSPEDGYGVRRPYAYPYYGYGYAPGSSYYDMPYDRDEATAAAQNEEQQSATQ